MDRNNTSLTFWSQVPETHRAGAGRRRKWILEVAVHAAELLRQNGF
jgi:hypothetical protein